MTTIPHGAWPSPISVDEVLAAAVGFTEVRTDAESVLWLEVRPAENGRSTIMRLDPGASEAVELSPDLDVRTRHGEYGGGAWAVDRDVVVACDDRTRRLWLLREGHWTPLSSEVGDVRYGDLRLHTDRGLLLAVQEDHRAAGEPVARIVAFDLPAAGSSQPATPRVLVEGADFYSDPELSRPVAGVHDGVLAWCQWQHPNMPWDLTELVSAPWPDPDAGLGAHTVVSEGTSALHPRWTPAGLVHVSDQSGYWNWYLASPEGTRSITTSPHDHDEPQWTLGNQSWAVWPPSDPSRVVGMRYRQGQAEIVTATLAGTGETTIAVPDLAAVESLAASEEACWAVLAFTTRPPEVVRLDPVTGQVTTLARAGRAPDADLVSVPQSLTADGPHGQVQAWFYPPLAPGIQAPAGDLPPLVVLSHGGPTGMSHSSYSSKVQYWTSRGFAVVDVNYGGSTGFGREYRNRLRGNWGIVDVDDCRAVVEDLVARGRVDGRRVAITGGSAGGYTTLQSLVTTDVYTAGVSRYGIGDLALLASDTHKFESRYLDGLVGAWPDDEATYTERSPIHHVDALSVPMLILQGTEDKVVPPAQAESMARAVKDAGQPVAMVMFEGEGHGFRGVDSRRRALLAEHAFYVELWQLDSPDDLPALTWL
ncbi:S9 family peptidase [Tessaracoccus sp. SD287]|uniref:S9 family peptidase n=1 Tax=Tessaracoccus sp. SD287 TaxID=2782008 RepID=UPI001A9797AB|nr:prolyl oligopeptidase family serine peptidase [Tessaracoccus sp. SD287]MBO1031640.1 S9 family peptidase [Tessaracoccus sp. SD287]